MNIGFTGHRNRITDPAELRQLEQDYPNAVWIHGGAQGFDTQVHTVALELGKREGVTLIVIRPDYKKYPRYVAPIVRNREIVERSDLLVACWDGRGEGGTRQCKSYAEDRGVPVRFVSVKETE
jgi:hypothetical protein